MMRLMWSRGLPEQPELREQWNALVFQMEKPEVFYTWEWAAAIVRAFGSSVEPWIATAYEGDELVGVVALAKSSKTEVVFLAGNTADYCDFVSRPAQRTEFVAHVLRDLREAGTERLVLANLPADSATVGGLKRDRSFKSFLRTGYICSQVRLGVGEERQKLIESLLKKKMYRRSINTLQRIGPVTLQHDGGTDLGRIDRFCVTHVARFLSTERVSNLVSAPRREFLRELTRLLGERGWFDLMTLRAGRFVLALNYGFRFHGSWFWYQPTIVNKFEDLSPGYCLLAKIIEDAGRDVASDLVDLGLGAEEYKERFANAERTTLYATLSCSGIDLWKGRARYRAAEAIKKRSKMEAVARRLQASVQGARKRAREDGWAHVLAWSGRRLQKAVAGKDEVFLYQWLPHRGESGERVALAPVTWEILAAAAMRYSEDGETTDYLLRASARFRSGTSRGYAVLGADGVAQHFAWVSIYEGFAMAELNQVLRAPAEISVMIFDCWTPREYRGQGLYARAIAALAEILSAEGKDVWIFSAAANPASAAGIEKAGFQKQVSLFRGNVLGWTKRWQESHAAPRGERAGVLPGEPVR